MLTKTSTPNCFHGGAVYRWVGDDFEGLDRIGEIIDADVLDAWFAPSPRALEVLSQRLAWSLRCSPPVEPHGVERAISRLTGISSDNLVCGAGSSSLIFMALRELLTTSSRVLLLDPTYGEYIHVLSNVIGCEFDSFELHPHENYEVDLERLVCQLRSRKYDLVILVNPNNPSGELIQRILFEDAIKMIPQETLVWVDEAYIDYAALDQSLGSFAASRPNVVVCKSLSKVLALSGLRVAYMVSNSSLIRRLKLITPPWSLSLPAQLVLVEALKDREYYEQCYALTHQLRDNLTADLIECGYFPRSGTANFLLVDYPSTLPAVEEFLSLCSERQLLLRNVRNMGRMIPDHCFRVAVKDSSTNQRIVGILREVKNGYLSPTH